VEVNVNFFEHTFLLPDLLRNFGMANVAESDNTKILNFYDGDDDYDDGVGGTKVNHLSIDEKEKESSVNYIQAALPPRITSSKSKNKSIFDLLEEAGIPYQNDSQNTSNNSTNAKDPFTHLWGVYYPFTFKLIMKQIFKVLIFLGFIFSLVGFAIIYSCLPHHRLLVTNNYFVYELGYSFWYLEPTIGVILMIGLRKRKEKYFGLFFLLVWIFAIFSFFYRYTS
jgi:hypothetical protein